MSPSARKILIHYHIFKNAGTSIERSLEGYFGPGLFRFETERPDGHLRPDDATRLIEANPDLRAISSHQLHPPVPSGPFEAFPLVMIREPISRVRSAYLFEWHKQPGLPAPKGSFADYVEWRLTDPRPGVVADFQVTHLSRCVLQDRGDDWTDLDAGLDVAMEFLSSLPGFGLVERFDQSVHLLNRDLRTFYGSSDDVLEARRDNVTQDPAMSLDDGLRVINDELGEELLARLLDRNRFDRQLYRWAVDLFDERWRAVAPALEPERSVAGYRPDLAATIGPDGRPLDAAEGDHQAGRLPHDLSNIELTKLARRVQWQDEVLSKVDEEREHDRSLLETTRSELEQTRRELLTLRAREALDGNRPSPSPPASPWARLAARLQSRLGTVRERIEPAAVVEPPLLTEQRMVAESGLFDPEFYRERNPDVVAAGMNVLEHYVMHGGSEGRPASRLFDSARYLRDNPDVRQSGMNPLVHYMLHGRDEERSAYTLDGERSDLDDNPYRLPTPDQFDDVCAGMRFTDHGDGPIDVSIVIPVYNEVAHTIACLEAVAGLATRYRYEVVVMDDCSDDPAMKYVQSIDGLRFVHNEANLGFLRNCNRGAELARGRYVAFLNNDTRVDSGWLDPLVSTLDDDATIGLVGSKLVYPDGRLQEAGGIIFADASGWNYGRLEDPDHPLYNHVRDVDYISGASIMIDRDYFDRLGRFDEAFVPAYYEDTDLCFRIRADGRRVVYQPASVVVHFEGVSSGTDLGSGVKRHQVVNRAAFELKWQDVLQAEHASHDQHAVGRAADRMVRGHVLVLDATVPTPDQDSGSVDMFNLLKVLTEAGYRVHFVPSSGMQHAGRYTVDLQQLGVRCVYAPFYQSATEYLAETGDIFDAAIVSRVNVATACINDVFRYCPSARTVFYTVDLHFLRAQRQAELGTDRRARRLADELRQTELSIMDQVDTTIVLSERERELLAGLGRERVEVLPLIREPSPPPRTGFEGRDGVAFVGGFRHPPNVDAVHWLIDEIWPLVRERCRSRGLAPMTLRIIGSNIPRNLATGNDDIEVYGFVENLQPIFERTLISVAPLRYGAGLKGKIATSFDHGVPVVGTSMAFEGMPRPGLDDVLLCAETAAGLADLIVDVSTAERRWQELSAAARSYNETNYSVEALRPRIEALAATSESDQQS